MKSGFLLLIATALAALPGTASAGYKHSALPNKVAHFHRGLPAALRRSPVARTLLADPLPAAPSTYTGLRVSPADFGGDPTGRNDSTAALQKALQVCLSQGVLSPNGLFPGSTSFPNNTGIRDMGGCFIDLEGGEYLISQPLVIPEYNANFQLGFGSLVASPSFPQNEFLIIIGKTNSCNVPQGSCNIDLNFPNLFMDGQHIANCIQINHVMGTTIGPGGYFLNFSTFGVQINDGHEVMIDRVWMGETNYDFDFEGFHSRPNATAIAINGNDHYVSNTIVFSSRHGVEVNGAADVLVGVHVWFPINRALAFNDTAAFYVTGGGNRFISCYIDGGRGIFTSSGLNHNTWTNGFECCAGSGLGNIPHGILLQGDQIGPGMVIVNNEFGGGSIWAQPSTAGKVPKVVGTRIESNSFGGNAQSSRARQTLTQTNATSWTVSFCSQLIVPQIASYQFSFAATEGFPTMVGRPAQGCNVTVEASLPTSGTLVVDADVSYPDPNFL